ncbi:RNA-binding KH domain-containing protein [Striga asiatica]|uniref:RNA-binding KH domain-containing protein n=1 Tax=Striga asiatica TaxID=4170 RepID=A0A5A7QEL0_STRAF|nr:RNA-binding KH domain-containing protein [Striga asiatica]
MYTYSTELLAALDSSLQILQSLLARRNNLNGSRARAKSPDDLRHSREETLRPKAKTDQTKSNPYHAKNRSTQIHKLSPKREKSKYRLDKQNTHSFGWLKDGGHPDGLLEQQLCRTQLQVRRDATGSTSQIPPLAAGRSLRRPPFSISAAHRCNSDEMPPPQPRQPPLCHHRTRHPPVTHLAQRLPVAGSRHAAQFSVGRRPLDCLRPPPQRPAGSPGPLLGLTAPHTSLRHSSTVRCSRRSGAAAESSRRVEGIYAAACSKRSDDNSGIFAAERRERYVAAGAVTTTDFMAAE